MSECVGVVPAAFAELFLDSLRTFAPSRKISGSMATHGLESVCELWVSPPFGSRQLAAWSDRWFELQAQMLSN